VSKIYEALKRAEQDRERVRPHTPAPPPLPELPSDGATRRANQEDYQKLRASLVSIAVPSGLHTVLVTAPNHAEGTTTVSIGLATALGREREARVLLIEGNLRTPSIRLSLPVPPGAGFADFAAGRAAPEALATRLEGHNFSVIQAGNLPAQGVDLELVDGLLTRLRPQFDFIVIDGPPVNAYADASVLASRVDGVILVVEADQTPVADAETAKRQLAKVGARILGVVLNRRRSYIPAFLESIL
jgi:capsular exopolysaccharide synthesis family protein